jgi:CRISPR-associated protein Csm5
MKTFSAYRLLFTPLSPVHIGTGDSYEPTNYVIEGDTLHEFDTGSVVEALSATDRQALNAIVNRSPDDTMIKAVQKFFHDRRATLMPRGVHRIPVQAGVVRLYGDRVGQTAQQESAGRRVINQLEINRTAYNPVTRLPVLMGSSVKGAIRTALLDQVNAGRSTTEREGLHPFQGKADLFRYYDRRPVCERDPMRLVQIGDAGWQGEPGLPAAEIVFAVNRKKAPIVDRQGNQRSTRADSGPPQILECIPAFRYRAFAGQLNVQLLDGVNKPGEVPAADLRFDMNRIAHACNAFYRPILQNEIGLLSQCRFLDAGWGKALNEILGSSLLESGGTFLLRVGRNCGAVSVTLNGVRKIKIMQGRGRGPRQESAATTIWLAAKERDQESGLLPFGWVFVEFSALEGRKVDENSSLKGLCEQRLSAVRQWADRVKAKESEWQRKGLAPQAVGPRGSQPGSTRSPSPWVDQKLAELCSRPGIKPDDALRGPALAEAARVIEDPVLRAQTLADIVARWKEKGWWERTTGGQAKKAKAIYDEMLKASHQTV